MRKARTRLLEQGTQTSFPAPDFIPAETENQLRTHIGIGAANGGTSPGRYDDAGEAQSSAEQRCHPVFQLARRACSQQLAQNQAQVEGSHVDHVADFAFSRRSPRSSPVHPRDPNHAVGLVIFLLQRLMSETASSRLATENKGSVLRIPYVHVIVLAGNVAEAAKVPAMHSRSSRNHACGRRATVSLLCAGVSHVIPDVDTGILVGVMEHQLVEAGIECHSYRV